MNAQYTSSYAGEWDEDATQESINALIIIIKIKWGKRKTYSEIYPLKNADLSGENANLHSDFSVNI